MADLWAEGHLLQLCRILMKKVRLCRICTFAVLGYYVSWCLSWWTKSFNMCSLSPGEYHKTPEMLVMVWEWSGPRGGGRVESPICSLSPTGRRRDAVYLCVSISLCLRESDTHEAVRVNPIAFEWVRRTLMFLKVVCLFPGGNKGCVGHTWKALTVFQKVLVSLTHVHTSFDSPTFSFTWGWGRTWWLCGSLPAVRMYLYKY